MEKTIKNLAKAFLGESQARNRYTFYAKQARKEGLFQIADIFEETAENEREHAKGLYKLIIKLSGKDELSIDGVGVPIKLKETLENLKAAAAGELYEHTQMYPEFAKVAKEEGLEEIAERILAIAKVELHHEKRYRTLIEQLENGTLLKKSEKKSWKCRKCGYIHEGEEPPEKCPSCDHESNYFEILCEEF